MKRLLSLIAVAGLCAATIPVSSADERILIRFSHVNTDNTPKGFGANRFAELAHERFPDQVRVEVYPSGQLYSDGVEMEALALGNVELLAPSMSKLHRYTKELQLFDLPFLFDDIDAVDRFQATEQGQAMLDALEPYGFIGLGFLHNGMKQLSARSRIEVPEDMQGVRIRIQHSDVIESYYRAVGANPQKLAFPEVYHALQTGVVDGQENSWTSIYTMKFFEVQPYIVEANIGVMDFLVITNADWWNRLPEDLRVGLREVMDQAVAEANEKAETMHSENRQRIVDADTSEIIQLTPEQRALWIEAMQPVYSQWEDVVGADLIAAAQAANNGGSLAETSAVTSD